jgi:quinoprotein glucose dehydrogenase
MPTGDYYGGHRPGNTLFSESLVAVDLTTGKRKWHYQFVHHGIWDHDLPCAPILADITVDGKQIKAVAQPAKQGWVYVLDRLTGQPVWPFEERPVEKGDVPGEQYSPTQPFVTKPPPFERQGVSIDDLIDFTPELRAEAVKLVSRYKIGPLFTPPVVSKWEGPLATLMLPNVTGGANWQGGSLDPETNIFYIFTNTNVAALGLAPGDGVKSDMLFVRGFASDPNDKSGRPSFPNTTVQGLPLIKPPYGRITALDLNKGDLVWQIAHGDTPDNIKNPAHGPSGPHWRAHDQDAADCRRRRHGDHAEGTGRDAARLQQGNRPGSRRGVHARAADRIADDLPAQRTAVHHRVGQRAGFPG